MGRSLIHNASKNFRYVPPLFLMVLTPDSFLVLLELILELPTLALLLWKETIQESLKMLKVSAQLREKQALDNCTLGVRTTPSTVAFTEDGQRLVGIPAKRQVCHLQKIEGSI